MAVKGQKEGAGGGIVLHRDCGSCMKPPMW